MKSTLQKYKSVFSVLIYSQNHVAVAPIPEHVNPALPGPGGPVRGRPSSHLPGTGLQASAAPPFRARPCRACFQASFLLMAKVLGCFLVSLAGKHSSSCRSPILSLWKRVNGHEDQGQKRKCQKVLPYIQRFYSEIFQAQRSTRRYREPLRQAPPPGFRRRPRLMISDTPAQAELPRPARFCP